MVAETLLLPILIPLAGGILMLLIPTTLRWFRAVFSLIATGAAFVSGVAIFIDSPGPFQAGLLQLGNFDLIVSLEVSPLSSFILMFALSFGFLVAIYSLAYMTRDHKLKGFHSFMLLALSGTACVLLTDHLILLLIAWEIVTASLYFLISTGTQDSKKAATKTFAVLGAADACLLLGIALYWVATGSFSMSVASITTAEALPIFAFAFMAIGALAKAGSMPVHSWIPTASEAAPLTVMALLPAAIDKLLGIYLLVTLVTRLFELTSGIALVLMILGAFTIIAAVLLAMVQHDMKKLLSFHAISQVGYMVLGIGTLTPIGILGGVFHMANNSIYKGCLFLCAGSVEKRTGTTDLAQLGGLAKAMPYTFIAALISALAISGVPPLNGFVSKWFIYQGIIDTGMRGSFVFLIAAMFGSSLTLASFVKLVYSVFLGERTETSRAVRSDSPFPMVLPLIVLALACVVFGVFYSLPVDRLLVPAIGAFDVPGVWNSGTATLLMIAGLILGMVIYLTGRTRSKTRTVAPFIGGETLNGETGRIIGTHFYRTIRDLPILSRIFDKQEKERLDPYTWFGGLGLSLTRLLKYAHNGSLSWYMSWSIFGMIVLIVLFTLLL